MRRRWTFFAACAAVATGALGGTALDTRHTDPPAHRGEYLVLEADFHAHTRFSDGFLSPLDVVLQARRRGLDVLAITEHNLTFPGQIARWYSQRLDGPIVLVGEEVTTNRFHLHGIGLTRRVDASQSVRDVIADIHAQGGVAIAAHPVRRFWPTFEPVRDRLDGAEVMHPLVFGGASRSAGWRWEEIRQFYVKARADGHPLMAIGSSDYHFFSPLGVCRTLLFTRGQTEADVMEALRARRTVVYDPSGTPYGDPDMIALLERDPYATRVQDYDDHGRGAGDWIVRVVGFLGLLGVVLFAGRAGASVRRGRGAASPPA